jgi:hypothetical protein
MDNKTAQKKDSILKVLAITGFIGIIVFIAWASIQLVSVVPGAFSSLASLAESVNQQPNTSEAVDDLTVTSNTLLANTGDPVHINWNTARANGSYVFSYNCAEGVAIDLVSDDGLQSIQCDTNYNIGNVDSTTITIDSEKNRYTDITYSVSFLGTNDTRPRATGNASLTVLNSEISTEIVVVDDEQTEEETPAESANEPEVPATEATSSEPVTPTPTTPVTPEIPEYTQEYVYEIPTSQPNGKTNLAARYLFVGAIEQNKFVPGAVAEDEDGAIQFEVKNLGTKTSKDWSFTVHMPGDRTYESPTQSPLKPNERAVLTIGFIGADVNSHTFEVTVDVATDSNPSNNDFSHQVTFFD